MNHTQYLPTQDAVQRLLLGLINRNLNVKRNPSIPWIPKTQSGMMAEYVRDDKSLWALWIMDLQLAGGIGSALTLIPTDSLGNAMKTGRLTQDMTDNMHEIFNIASSVFNREDIQHLRLDAVHMLPGTLPEKAAALLAKPPQRLDLELTIAGYGDGRMSLLSL